MAALYETTVAFHKPADDSQGLSGWWYVGNAGYDSSILYDCNAEQNVGTGSNKYINVLCDAAFSGDVVTTSSVKCTGSTESFGAAVDYDCTSVTCDSLDAALCAQAVDIYTDDGSKAVYTDTCIDASGSCVSRDPVLFHPPTDDSASVAQWWFVGSDSFDRSTAYACDTHQNVGTGGNAYINVLCDQTFSGSVTTADTVQCYGVVESNGFGTDNKIDCSPVDCDSLPAAYCSKAIDIYTDDGSKAVYADTCILASGSCVSRAPVLFHPPTDASASVAGWWFVGNASYDRSTSYACDTHQDVGTGGNAYINVLCDPSFSGAVVQTDSIQCSGDLSHGFGAVDQIDCSPTDCAHLPAAYCSTAIDLYTDDGSKAVYADTCITDGGEGCQSQPPLEFHAPEDTTNQVSGWWFVGSAVYDTTIAYPCDDDQDIGSDGNPYINVLCDRSFTGAVVETDSIKCNDPVTLKGFGAEVAIDCSPIECTSLPQAMCNKPVDLYIDDGTQAVYTDTCVDDQSSGCISQPMAFHPPTNEDEATTTWWYVGRPEYDSTVTYECNDDQDVGSDAAPYLNVLCDVDFTGAIAQSDKVKCNDPDSSNGLREDRSVDCNAIDCSGLTPSMCQEPVDLYIDNGARAALSMTCVQSEDAASCIAVAATTPEPVTSNAMSISIFGCIVFIMLSVY